MRSKIGFSLVLFVGICLARDFPKLNGNYFGQPLPGDEPVLFAPNLISNGFMNRDVAMTPAGDEMFFGAAVGAYTYSVILFTRRINGRWTKPEIAPFSGNPQYMDLEPCISPDGKNLYYLSIRPDSTGKAQQDIWKVSRENGEWGTPVNPGQPINSDAPEFFPSVTRDGTLYFTRNATQRVSHIYRSRMVNGIYQDPERLPEQVNSGTTQFNAFIDPDERYIIVCVAGRSDTYGGTDYYITFRNDDDTWDGPYNLGEKINTEGSQEFSPYVSPDGQFFFFMATRQNPVLDQEKLTLERLCKLHNSPENGYSDIYWVRSSCLDRKRFVR